MLVYDWQSSRDARIKLLTEHFLSPSFPFSFDSTSCSNTCQVGETIVTITFGRGRGERQKEESPFCRMMPNNTDHQLIPLYKFILIFKISLILVSENVQTVQPHNLPMSLILNLASLPCMSTTHRSLPTSDFQSLRIYGTISSP